MVPHKISKLNVTFNSLFLFTDLEMLMIIQIVVYISNIIDSVNYQFMKCSEAFALHGHTVENFDDKMCKIKHITLKPEFELLFVINNHEFLTVFVQHYGICLPHITTSRLYWLEQGTPTRPSYVSPP